jgi:hypothetical protein
VIVHCMYICLVFGIENRSSVIQTAPAVTQYYLLTHGAEPFLRSRQLCTHSRFSQHFMEPEGSIPCSQQPSTGPYPEPYHFNPHHPSLSLLRSILILSTHLRLFLPSGLFPSGFPTNILYAITQYYKEISNI